MSTTNRQWRLARRPSGAIDEGDLELHESAVPDLGDGEVLVRNVYLSLDPTNRIWMSDQEQYLPPVAIGEVMRGGTLGVVEASRNPRFAAGDLVNGLGGWQDFTKTDGTGFSKLPKSLGAPLVAFMGPLGMTGLTAYFGLLDIGRPQAGETVVVTGAAGAVGSIAGQIAKIHGCRAVGVAGSDEKCRWIVDELGYDAAINYKSEDVEEALRRHCPDGVDVDFENVGGEILDAILGRINLRARIVLCGLISQYNAEKPAPGPYRFGYVLMKRARVEGFIILDYAKRYAEGLAALGGWLAEGKLSYRTDVVDGLENALVALQGLFAGDNIGKRVVKVSDEPG